MAAPIIQRPTKYWFADDYEGSEIDPNVGVAHTTEGTSLPWYDGGAKAPTYTGTPDFAKRRLVWTQHFPDTMSARALRNEAGGVETNTLNCLQIELVGTCDPATSKKWTAAGRQHIFWPKAPQWALDELAEFVALKHRERGIRIEGPEQVGKAWAAYPASYGKGASQRFSFTQWKNFYGWCGHQHVPENDHGDPGALPWAYVETKAKAIVAGGATKPPATPKPPVEDDVQLSDPVGPDRSDPKTQLTLGEAANRGGYAYYAIMPGGPIANTIAAQAKEIADLKAAVAALIAKLEQS